MNHYSVETITPTELANLSGGPPEEDLEVFINERAKRGLTLVSVLPSEAGFAFVWLAAPKAEHKK